MDEQKLSKDFSNAEPLDIARQAALVLLKKQARELKLFHVATATVIADYYIIVSGRSSTQVKALADEVAEKMGEYGVPAVRIEGRDGASWILVDFGSVIVHVFDREARTYYHLERLLSPEDELDTAELEEMADEAKETV